MTIEIMTPQFERVDGRNVPEMLTSAGPEFLDWLKKQDDATLKLFGLQLWDNGHWLYPGEWFDLLPEGYPVVTIFEETKPFNREKCSNDIRFGALAYGFKRGVSK